jgi:pimeloyl-ACP methyl ester carboxylesterase
MNIKLILPSVFVVLFIGLLGWYLFRPKNRAVTVPAGARAGDLILKPCTVKLNGVKYAADCGTLVVPENRANPASCLIALPVKRIHSSNTQPTATLFYLNGGPGQSNMGFKPPTWLLANQDVVLVGYRGVDGTSKLDCPEVAKALKGVGEDLLGAASLEAIGKAVAGCASRMQAEGVDLAGYTIPEVVEDMESARTALGCEQINLLSESYGTRVAQIYAIMHPASLLRSAMIGVNPPGHMFWKPEVVDAQLAYYAGLWKKAEGPAAPDLVGAMRSVNADMPHRWLFLPINPGKVQAIAFMLLFHRSTSPMVFDAYVSAARGDPSGLALMTLAYDMMMPKAMTWGEFFALGYSSDYEPGRDYMAELNQPEAVLGAPMSTLVWGGASRAWPPIAMAAKYRQVQPSDVETLLISGSVDFSTPVQFAEQELLPSLHKGQHVIISEQGHTGDFWGFQPEARQRLLTSFYDTGAADASLYTLLPMNFKPSMRFPVLAKVLVAVSVILVFGLVWAVWGSIRRISRRKATKKSG